MTQSARFGTVETVREFLFAGHARLTLVSERTGARFTYRVTKAKEEGDDRFFVAVLTGANNEDDYTYIGTIFERERFAHGKKARVRNDAPSVLAFAYFFAAVRGGELPARCEVWHEGRCGRCGRALTVPESIATGIGPVCEERAAA